MNDYLLSQKLFTLWRTTIDPYINFSIFILSIWVDCKKIWKKTIQWRVNLKLHYIAFNKKFHFSVVALEVWSRTRRKDCQSFSPWANASYPGLTIICHTIWPTPFIHIWLLFMVIDHWSTTNYWLTTLMGQSLISRFCYEGRPPSLTNVWFFQVVSASGEDHEEGGKGCLGWGWTWGCVKLGSDHGGQVLELEEMEIHPINAMIIDQV